LLPRWRGAAPIQRAVLAGDRETGVCTQRMEEGLDTGPLYLARTTPIGPHETAGALHDRLAQLAAQIAVDTLRIVATAVPVPQAEEGVTWAPKIDRDEARLDFTMPAEELDRRIRGYTPWPGAFVDTPKGPLRIEEARVAGPQDGSPGTVLATNPLIVAAGGGTALQIDRLRPPGRKSQSGAEYANGARLSVGGRAI
jgi:methionyl-tRNA formyltransferase